MNRPLLWTAIVEGLVVLALGFAVVVRGGSEPPPMSVPVPGTLSTPTAPTERGSAHAPPPAGTAETDARAPCEPSAAPVETVAPDDPVGIVLHGTVREQSGGLLDGASITLTAGGGERWRTHCDRRSPGVWSLAGIPPGNYVLRCRSSAYVPLEEEIELSPSPRVQRQDLVLERMLAVDVRFVDGDGNTIEPSRWMREFGWAFHRNGILATESPLPDRIPVDEQGEPDIPTVGRLRIDEEAAVGRVLLSQPPPVWVSAQSGGVVLQGHRVEPGQDEVVFALAPEVVRGVQGKVTLRFVNADTGQPVVDVFVRVGLGSGNPDARGVVTRTLAPGDHPWSVYSEGRYEHAAGAFHLEPGEELDLGTIALGTGRPCGVSVLDESGQAVAAHLSLGVLDTDNHRLPVVMSSVGQARADGAFDLKGLPPRRCLVRAATVDQHMVGYAAVDGSSPPAGLRLVVRPTIRLGLQNALDVYAAVDVIVRDAEGLPLWASQMNSRSRAGPRLPVGTYRVEVLGQGTARSYPLTVGPGGATLEVP